MDVKAQIEESLSNPKKVQTDSGAVEQFDLSDQLKAAEYLEKKEAQERGSLKRLGFYRARHVD